MAKRFFKALIIGVGLGLAGVTALNVYVDPTGFARAANLRDTAFCPGSESHVSDRFSRVLRFESLNPQTVIMGTSRVKTGFYKSALIESGYPDNFFNFGISSMTATEMTELLPRIARANHVQNLIAGIDYGMFAGQQKGKNWRPIIWTDKNKFLSWIDPFYRSFLAAPATGASLKSIWSGCEVRSFSVDGFPRPETDYRPPRLDAAEGYEQRRLLNYRPVSALADRGGPLVLFSTALGDVCALGRKIDLFIEPSHARLNEIRFKGGLWPETEGWKRKLTDMVAKLRQQGCEISLTDFSGYNHVTTFPFENGNSPSKYYSDPSHYTPDIGSKIIRRISGTEKEIPVDSFGVTLTPKNVEAQIKRIREERNAYLKAR